MHEANVCMSDCSNSNPVLNNVTELHGARFIRSLKISVVRFGENSRQRGGKERAVPGKEAREISPHL